MASSSSSKQPSPPFAGDGVPITEKNAHIYAPIYLRALVEMGYKPKTASAITAAISSTNTAAPSTETATIPTALVIASVLPPDTKKYTVQKNGQLIIPASEAVSFIVHYKPGDKMPLQIEGYAWYCNECYTDERVMNKGGKGKNVKGEFGHKRTVEKHFTDTHRVKWEPVLPEPRRG